MGVRIMKIIGLLKRGMSGRRRGWAILLLILLGSCVTGFLQAQAPPPEPPQAPAQSVPRQLSPEELNGLLAPIALYPDALIALILPASTVPSEVVLAARYITSNGDPAQVANQPWDDSVKSLARYPDVLKWMDQNLEWTTAVGEAFLDQPADVMNSIQRLRAEAIAAGNLTNSPQQQVVQEETVIRIVPAQPDVIYVPQYDPDVVYVRPYSQDFGPLLTFGAGFAVGSWLNYDCDWGRRSIYVGQWRPGWNHNRNWDRGDRDRNWDRKDQGRKNWDRKDQDREDQDRNNNIVNVININSDTARQWQPSANIQRRQAQHPRSNRANARSARVKSPDANHQPGERSTPDMTTGFDPSANQIPKPSQIDFTNQGNSRIRPALQDSNRSSKTSQGSPSSSNVDPNASEVTTATPGARGKNRKLPAPTAVPNVQGEQGKPLQGGDQGSDARNLSKHAQGRHQNVDPSPSGVTATTPGERGKSRKLDAPAATTNVQGEQGKPGASTQKHQKHVEDSQGSSSQSKTSPQSSNGPKHKQKQAQQSAPPIAKQDKPSQPPPAVTHQDQHSQRSTSSAPAPQTNAAQPSNASQGKGKGGGEKKSDKKKDKDEN